MADGDKYTGYIINDDFTLSETEFVEDSMPALELNVDPSDEEAWKNAQPRLVMFFSEEHNLMAYEEEESIRHQNEYHIGQHMDKNFIARKAAELAQDEFNRIEKQLVSARANMLNALNYENNAGFNIFDYFCLFILLRFCFGETT